MRIDATTSDTIALLREARERLFDPGWIQGDLHGTGGDCASGAVEAVYETGRYQALTYAQALNALAHDTPGGDIAAFNDTPGRTRGEMVDLFDGTIKRLETENGGTCE